MLTAATLAWAACPDCAPALAARAAIRADPNVWTYVALMLAPFAVVGLGWALRGRGLADRPIVSAGILLGVGLGGFVDGIALHQMLQWHNMLSSWIPPDDLVAMKINMVWDGAFHIFTWTMTAVGLALLWRAGLRRDVVPWVTRTFVGALLLGWGLFNAIEGVVDHQILGVHHVHPGRAELAWDLGFIASGVALVVVGLLLIRSGRRTTDEVRA